MTRALATYDEPIEGVLEDLLHPQEAAAKFIDTRASNASASAARAIRGEIDRAMGMVVKGGLVLAGVAALGGVAWWLWKRRKR